MSCSTIATTTTTQIFSVDGCINYRHGGCAALTKHYVFVQPVPGEVSFKYF